MITFIIPTRNNLPYLKLAWNSIRKFYPRDEIIILDDGSTDGTLEWVQSDTAIKEDNYSIYDRHVGRQLGHTILYDRGVDLSRTDIFTIFHADMVCAPNYIENLLKHLEPETVVCGTRIEPPLHPPGKEKLIKDFGIYPKDFKQSDFEQYCRQSQDDLLNKDKITRGIFAPWIMYKKDFLAIGGHDKLFSPFPFEDSDIFQRFILAGYKLKQSRDAFVYHFTSRGHRWSEEVGKDDLLYKLCCAKNSSHFIRKWGSWIKNDEYSYPIIKKKYDIGLIPKKCDPKLIPILEPICSTLFIESQSSIDDYITKTQAGTPFNLKRRLKNVQEQQTNDILVEFDTTNFTQNHYEFISNLSDILYDSGEIGVMEYDIFKFDIRALTTYETNLIKNNDPYYQHQLIKSNPNDPFHTDELFKVFEDLKKKTQKNDNLNTNHLSHSPSLV